MLGKLNNPKIYFHIESAKYIIFLVTLIIAEKLGFYKNLGKYFSFQFYSTLS